MKRFDPEHRNVLEGDAFIVSDRVKFCYIHKIMYNAPLLRGCDMSDALTFTDSAAAKVWELIQEEDNFELKLRVYVTGGGCSGFQYGFTFDETVNEDDTTVSKSVVGVPGSEVLLLVDPMSFQYLAGSEIDYKEDIEGAQFIIRNPNAKTTCGCGSSFSA
jgi:Iron-sulfur cluster assembly accessory protein